MSEQYLLLHENMREIFSYMNPRKLCKFLKKNPDYNHLFATNSSLLDLAVDYGLPYFDGITLKELSMYQKMKKSDLLIEAAKLPDFRVIHFLLQPHKIIEYKFGKYNYVSAAFYITEHDECEEIIQLLVNLGMDDYDHIMRTAAYNGNVEIVEMMLKLGAKDYEGSMARASSGDNIEIVQMMLKLGVCNYDNTMYGAAKAGNKEIVQMMLDLGACNFDITMLNAARGGHIEIVEMMLDLGALNYNQTMINAAQGGHKEIVQMMLKLGVYSYNNAMYAAAKAGNKEIVQLMLNSGATGINTAMSFAAQEGHEDIVDMMIGLGADSYDESLSAIMTAGMLIPHNNDVKNRYLSIIQKMINLGTRNINLFNDVLFTAAQNNHKELIKLMIDNGADDYIWCACNAAGAGHKKIVKMMLDLGVNNFDEIIQIAEKEGFKKITDMIRNYKK